MDRGALEFEAELTEKSALKRIRDSPAKDVAAIGRVNRGRIAGVVRPLMLSMPAGAAGKGRSPPLSLTATKGSRMAEFSVRVETDMSDLSFELPWRHAEPDRTFGEYSNAQTIRRDDARRPENAATPGRAGEPECTSPNHVMAASLSSRHVMVFPAPGRNAKGRMPAFRCGLHPVLRFDNGVGVEAAGPDRIQERAQRHCFTANSLTGRVKFKFN